MTSAEQAVATYLAANLSGGSWTVGTNIFRGAVRPIGSGVPEKALFCLETGGRTPEPYIGSPSAKSRYWKSVQVSVRSKPDDYSGGSVLARTVQETLHRKVFGGFISCLCDSSSPIYAGQDTNTNHHRFTINFTLLIDE